MNIIRKYEQLSIQLKATIAYILASVISKGLSIFTLPIFTRILSTEQMGIVGVFNSWIAILGPIASLALISGGFNVAMKEYKSDRDSYCSSILTLTFTSAAVFLLSYILLPNLWRHFVKLPDGLILLIIFGLFVQPGYDIFLAKSRYEYNYKNVFLLTVLLAVGASLISVVSILIAKQSGYDELGRVRLYANYFLIYAIDSIICIRLFAKGKRTYDKEFWSFSLRLSLPLIINSLSAEVLGVSDRLMINQMNGKSEVGIYTTIYSLGSLPIFVWSAMNMAYIPFLFERVDNTSEYDGIHKSSNVLVLFYGAIVIILSLFSPELIKIFATSDYIEAVDIVPIVALAIYYIAIANIYSNVLLYFKKTNLIMICTIVAAIVNIVLNLLLIPNFGYKAAGYTTLISYVIMAVLQRQLSRDLVKKNGINKSIYDERSLFFIQILVIGVCLISAVTSKLPIIRYSLILLILLVMIIRRESIIAMCLSITRR